MATPISGSIPELAPGLAPDDRHTLTGFAHYFPYHLDPALGDWDDARQSAGAIVRNTLAASTPDLDDVVTAVEVMTPLDIERRFAMTGGHQFHADMMPGQLFDQRPVPGCHGARTPIDNLYLCGFGAHPGGCIWGEPGRRAAGAFLAGKKMA